MGDVFSDASALYLSQVGPGRESQSSRSSRISDSDEWITGTFLKAMIPLGWLSRACRLSGKALATALAIWYLKGLRYSHENLKLTTAVVERFEVSRFSKSRALRDLERAGLIQVERRPRKNPLVTILKVDEEENTSYSADGRSSRFSGSDEWISGRFLKAKIPLSWLSRACRLSGKALATALAIWYLKGLRNSYEGLMLTTAVVERLGISRYSKSRALRDLERAGLIRVERRPQKNPLVTILKVDDEEKTPGREVEKNL